LFINASVIYIQILAHVAKLILIGGLTEQITSLRKPFDYNPFRRLDDNANPYQTVATREIAFRWIDIA
jgi:hypothetical protein